MCFSLVNPTSLENVKKKWLPEIQHLCPGTPFVLVGTKLDLRNQGLKCITNDEGRKAKAAKTMKCITTDEGRKAAKKMGKMCKKYVECSALTQVGLKEVFDNAITVGMYQKKKMINQKLGETFSMAQLAFF